MTDGRSVSFPGRRGPVPVPEQGGRAGLGARLAPIARLRISRRRRDSDARGVGHAQLGATGQRGAGPDRQPWQWTYISCNRLNTNFVFRTFRRIIYRLYTVWSATRLVSDT